MAVMNQAGQQPKETTFQPIISYNIPFNVLTVFHNIQNKLFSSDSTAVYVSFYISIRETERTSLTYRESIQNMV